MGDWMATVREHLKSAAFDVSLGGKAGPFSLEMAARRTRFELSKFGMSETFFLFANIDELDPGTLGRYSAEAFRHAKRHRKVKLPCGLFESVWSFAVALSPNVDAKTAEEVRTRAPTKHWAAAEIPVVYDTSSGALHYFEKTPVWGAAYYRGFRKQIERFLAGSGTSATS